MPGEFSVRISWFCMSTVVRLAAIEEQVEQHKFGV